MVQWEEVSTRYFLADSCWTVDQPIKSKCHKIPARYRAAFCAANLSTDVSVTPQLPFSANVLEIRYRNDKDRSWNELRNLEFHWWSLSLWKECTMIFIRTRIACTQSHTRNERDRETNRNWDYLSFRDRAESWERSQNGLSWIARKGSGFRI